MTEPQSTDDLREQLYAAGHSFPDASGEVHIALSTVMEIVAPLLAANDYKVDWDVVQHAVHRGIAEYSRSYFIPANGLFHGMEDKVADQWGELAAPYVTACIQEDLRKSDVPSGPAQEAGKPPAPLKAQQLRAAMDQWSLAGGIPPGRYRIHAEIGVERREGYMVLVPGEVEHGVKVGGLLNLGLVLLEPLTEVLDDAAPGSEVPDA